jgi:hypothetical protein
MGKVFPNDNFSYRPGKLCFCSFRLKDVHSLKIKDISIYQGYKFGDVVVYRKLWTLRLQTLLSVGDLIFRL